MRSLPLSNLLVPFSLFIQGTSLQALRFHLSNVGKISKFLIFNQRENRISKILTSLEIKIRKLETQEIDFLRENKVYRHRAQTLKVTYENALEIGSSAPFPAGAIDIFFKRKNVLTTLRLFKEGHLFIDISIPHIRYDILKEDVREAFDSFFISVSPFQPELYSIKKPNYFLKED